MVRVSSHSGHSMYGSDYSMLTMTDLVLHTVLHGQKLLRFARTIQLIQRITMKPAGGVTKFTCNKYKVTVPRRSSVLQNMVNRLVKRNHSGI